MFVSLLRSMASSPHLDLSQSVAAKDGFVFDLFVQVLILLVGLYGYKM